MGHPPPGLAGPGAAKNRRSIHDSPANVSPAMDDAVKASWPFPGYNGRGARSGKGCINRGQAGRVVLVYGLIRKKRDGGELSRDELYSFVAGYVAGEIPDYQVA